MSSSELGPRIQIRAANTIPEEIRIQQYVTSHDIGTKSMVMNALIAHYLPFASSDRSPEDRARIYLDSLEKLRYQMRQILNHSRLQGVTLPPDTLEELGLRGFHQPTHEQIVTTPKAVQPSSEAIEEGDEYDWGEDETAQAFKASLDISTQKLIDTH